MGNSYKDTMNLPETDFPMRGNLPQNEPKRLEKWQEMGLYWRVLEKNRDGRPHVLHDGPPYANGPIHIGHSFNKILKDFVNKSHAQRGFFTPYVPGWDCHGQPIEHMVERTLGPEKMAETSQPRLRELCREWAEKYVDIQREGFKRLGVNADWEHPYLTFTPDYEAGNVELFRDMYLKGQIYRGRKPIHWCKRCHTALAEAEIEYGDEVSPSIYVNFKLDAMPGVFEAAGAQGDAYILIWTTTPWTLPSNVALCVNPVETYVKVRAADGYIYYMAEALLDTVLGKLAEEGKPAYEVLETYTGQDLEYKEYEPLFDLVDVKEKAFYVTCDSYVTLTDGTGVVHIAPAFGEDDANVGRRYGLPFVQLVDEAGKMTQETPWAGTFCKEADKAILQDLENRGLLFDAPKFEHSYPHCWRCDTPLIYYARESWFIKMTAVKEDLIRNNNTINWIPESIGKGRFGDWLENVQDWGISRNRYWGTPLNIWECSCGHMHAVGSIEELKAMSDNCPDEIELHRPYIDQVTIRCPKCGGEMHRVPEVIDCWFDSGAMPFAQHHYPFENKEIFEQQFPADFISEAVDQTRGWFYSLLAISTLIFNKAPYRNVIVLGHVQDENGQKMSKSKGNAIDPFDALEEFGADAIRWYFYVNSAPWLPNRFHGKAVTEGQRKFMGTLWNTYAFFVLYANIDDFDAAKYQLDYDSLNIMDKWLLSKLNTLIRDVDDHMDHYRIPESARALQEFVDDMSNWYVRRSRERFWAKGMPQDKINAYMTLYTALVQVCKAAAPMIPFMTEEIYQNLVRSVDKDAPESIHLCSYPQADPGWVDKELEEKMDELLQIVVLGRACRNGANRKNRQPLAEMFVKAPEPLDGIYTEIIADELNIKKITFTDDVSGFISYNFKPQLKTVGPKYGKLLNGIRAYLTALDGVKAMEELRSQGSLQFEVDGNGVALSEEDLLIETAQMERYSSDSYGDVTVVLDVELTEALIEEGFIREIISKVQTMRKEAGFEVTDKIRVSAAGNERIIDLMRTHEGEICPEILAESMSLGQTAGYEKEWNINSEKVTLGVEKMI